jgi:hypothetical protein
MRNLDLLQWPAMAVTIVAAWYVASTRKRRRKIGYWLFLASNVLWIAWGLHVRAYALILLQLFLVGMNVRGLSNAQPETKADA